MGLSEKIREMIEGKRSAVIALGAAGLLLILLSGFLPNSKNDEKQPENESCADTAQSYCEDTEKRLKEFLENIDGAGEVEVYLTVGSGEQYVYAAEEKKVRTDSKTEEEEKYVIVGGGNSREPLIERVETPEITGAVIICTGCGNPVVEERIYKAVSAALDIPTSKIFVTKMK